MQSNKNSCMLDAYCYVTNQSAGRAIQKIGHDGSEDGFHTQEIIDLALGEGIQPVEIIRFPGGTRRDGSKYDLWSDKECDERFKNRLRLYSGILMGPSRTTGVGHALARSGHFVWDPATLKIYEKYTNFDTLPIEPTRFLILE